MCVCVCVCVCVCCGAGVGWGVAQEFVRVNDSFAFSVQLRGSRSSTAILGVHWLGDLEILVVTNTGAEVFEVRAAVHPSAHARRH
jgi:hypothetical protein